MSVKHLDKRKSRQQKKKRIAKKIFGTPEKPRLIVFRSLKQMYAQLVDDTSQRTILTVSSLSKEMQDELVKAKTKTEKAKIVGKYIAEKAIKMNYDKVVFDRSGYLYHGRVKALAEGAREGGLIF